MTKIQTNINRLFTFSKSPTEPGVTTIVLTFTKKPYQQIYNAKKIEIDNMASWQ